MTSWRNDARILDVANRVLLPLQRPSLAVPELEARPGSGVGRVDVRFAETVDDEAADVAEWFESLRAAHDETAAGRPHTGAILFRSKRHMQTFAGALAARGIPHRILGLGGLLATPEVVDVVSALRVIHDPTAGSALIRLLVGPRFAIGVADMAALYDLARELAVRDGALAPLTDELKQRLRSSRGADEAVSIVDAVDFVRTARDDYRLLERISPEGRARLRAAGEMLERLRRAAGQPILELIRLIETELRLDIELAVNESRGPARVAATQLRAFGDEVRAFLTADDRGTISSLLAWLDKAEMTDELMPRTEPPEPGVVQLLTIHGSKGLEWDAVAVVRLVEDELPGRIVDAQGWFGFGVRAVRRCAATGTRCRASPGIRRARWTRRGRIRASGTRRRWTRSPPGSRRRYPHGGALRRFKDGYRDYQRAEERRLAYVAVTRARTDLLLTGSHWSGQKPSASRAPICSTRSMSLGLDPIADPAGEDNPYEGAARTGVWPMDPLGGRRARVVRGGRRGAGGDRRAAPARAERGAGAAARGACGAAARRGRGRSDAGARLTVQGLRHRLRRDDPIADPPDAGAAVPADPARHPVPRLGGAAVRFRRSGGLARRRAVGSRRRPRAGARRGRCRRRRDRPGGRRGPRPAARDLRAQRVGAAAADRGGDRDRLRAAGGGGRAAEDRDLQARRRVPP